MSNCAVLAQPVGIPPGEQHVGRHVLDLEIDAHFLEHLHQHLFGLLAQQVAGRGGDAQLHAQAVLGADAVVALDPAGLVQELVGLLHAVFAGRLRAAEGAAGHHAVAHVHPAIHQRIDHGLLVGGILDRLTHLGVGEDRVRVGGGVGRGIHGGVGEVEQQQLVLACLGCGIGDALVLQAIERGEIGLGDVPQGGDLAGAEELYADLAAGQDLDDHLVEVGLARLPVIRIRCKLDEVPASQFFTIQGPVPIGLRLKSQLSSSARSPAACGMMKENRRR